MRWSLFFFIISIFQAQAISGYAQKTQLSLDFRNTSIELILSEIENQSEFYFLYNKNLVDVMRKVDIQVTNQKVDNILNQLFKNSSVSYQILGRQIALISGESRLDEATNQKKSISGKVINSLKEPLPGVSVVLKGTAQGMITDSEGRFTIKDATDDAKLIISFIGMKSQEISVGGKTNVIVVMEDENVEIEEVVAIGYGTQKKVNLTGAIATVSHEVFENRAVTNAAQALQGKVANLNVGYDGNSGGRPGAKPTFDIRGYSGLGTSYSPLVIVDGVNGTLDNINMNDIENLTVLKDAASSAIYGAQAAYGVILVTTKNGKRNEAPVVTYTDNFSINSPTVIHLSAGSLPFAQLVNEASYNAGGGKMIDDETMSRIEQYYFHRGSIPETVPKLYDPTQWADWEDFRSNANNDWFKEFFKSQMNQNRNISVRGGSERSSYMMSVGYTRDEGKLRFFDDNYSRYNAAAKISSDVTKWLTVGINVRYSREKTVLPLQRDWIAGNYYIDWLYRMFPLQPLYDPNGHFSFASSMGFLSQSQPTTAYVDDLWGTGTALFKILPGLTANVDYTWNKYNFVQTESRGLIYDWTVDNTPYLVSDQSQTCVWQDSRDNDYYTSNAYATYEKSLGGHSFKLMVGTQVENKNLYQLTMNKTNLIIPDKPSIATATGTLTADDGLDHWSTLGYFGRFNYDYKQKYLLEVNVRRDGSSRYAEKDIVPGYQGKWGTFPSFSAGWNIAKENFFASLSSAFNELKLRGSWGELGNMRGKSYQYISTVPYNANYNYIMGGSQVSAFTTPSLIAYNTWEKNRTLDFGFDFTSLKNRLTGSFDWYQKDIIGLITQGETLPAVLGANSPDTNNADIRNIGFELTLSWKDRFNVVGKPLTYNAYATLSDYQGKVIKYSNPKGIIGTWQTNPSMYISSNFYEGAKMGQIWGYTTDHIMVDALEAAQVNSSGSQSQIWGNWSQGDMKYKDLNGDENINYGSMTLDDHGDLSVIGNSTPRYNYSFGINAEWNSFDIAIFFMGVGKRQVWLNGVEAWGMSGDMYQMNAWKNTMDCWRNDGSNMNPYYPKFYMNDWGNKNLLPQTKYLDNAAYCRLKNLQIGYTIPERITQKVAMNKVRVYFSGDNLLTFSKINENFDPEVPLKNVYPLSKTVSAGLNVTF